VIAPFVFILGDHSRGNRRNKRANRASAERQILSTEETKTTTLTLLLSLSLSLSLSAWKNELPLFCFSLRFLFMTFFSFQDVATLVWSVGESPSVSMDVWSFMFVILKVNLTVKTKNGRKL